APAGAFGRRRWPWLLLAAAGLAGVIAYQHEVHYAIPYAHVLVALFSCGVLVSLHGVRVPERMRPTLARLSEASFGAYLVHVLVLGVLTDAFVGADLGGPAAVALVAGITVATTVLSFGAALLWGRAGASKVLG
ncbi:acyltransferase family protein, partial [Streptomyces sp. MBT72]